LASGARRGWYPRKNCLPREKTAAFLSRLAKLAIRHVPLIEVARCQLPRGKPRPDRHSKNWRGVIAGARLFSPGATGL
jgi:hypothetical protein